MPTNQSDRSFFPVGLAARWVGPAARWLALAAVLLLVPGAASAMPVQMSESDATVCLNRSTVAGQAFHDPVNGNFWVRHDTFSLPGEEGCSGAFIDGISVLAKTPYQIDSTPDVDDIDGLAEYTILDGELEDLWPSFHPNFGANFGMDPGGNNLPPLVGPEGMFTRVFACINAAGIADCLNNGSPFELPNIGGGFMIFSTLLGDGLFLCDDGECSGEDSSFTLTTIVHSNITDAPTQQLPQVPIPEMMVGWRFTYLVPEPSLLALLAPVAALAVLRRRR